MCHSRVFSDVINLSLAGQAVVSDSCHHVDFLLVDGDTKQGTSGFHGRQLLPLELGGIVDAHSPQALPFI